MLAFITLVLTLAAILAVALEWHGWCWVFIVPAMLLIGLSLAPSDRYAFSNVTKLHAGQTLSEVKQVMGEPDVIQVDCRGSGEGAKLYLEWGAALDPHAPGVQVHLANGLVTRVTWQGIKEPK